MATNPDSVPVRLVHTTGPLNSPEGYTVPGNQEIQLSSVSATYDGSAAGGNFIPTLSIYSQDGQLLTRTKVEATVTAGDSAVCTWVPFLRPKQTTPTPGTTLNAVKLWTTNMNMTVGNLGSSNLDYDNASSFDNTVFALNTDGAGRYYRVRYLKQGWYSAWCQIVFTSTLAAGATNIHFLYVGDTLSGASVSHDNSLWSVNVGPYFTHTAVRYCPDELDTLPTITELWVGQNSGASKLINASWWQHVYLGDSDF